MNKITLTFLGTGNAIPTERRNHTGILLSYDSESILFDCGEGIQRQFKTARISPSKLTRIFITHWHGDHTLGLPGLFQTLAMTNYNKTLHIYGPHGTKKFISLIQELLLHIKIKIEVHELSYGTAVNERDFQILAESMQHGINTLAYSFILKEKTRLNKAKIKKLKIPNSPLLGQLQSGKDITLNGKKIKSSLVTYKEKGKKVTIILDTKMNPKTIELAKNSDLLICESTFSEKDAEKASEYLHLTAKDAATIAKKSGSDSLILTHISERYEHNLSIIEKEAKKTFKNSKVVKDLDSVFL